MKKIELEPIQITKDKIFSIFEKIKNIKNPTDEDRKTIELCENYLNDLQNEITEGYLLKIDGWSGPATEILPIIDKQIENILNEKK